MGLSVVDRDYPGWTDRLRRGGSKLIGCPGGRSARSSVETNACGVLFDNFAVQCEARRLWGIDASRPAPTKKSAAPRRRFAPPEAVRIEPGRFLMGSPKNEGAKDERPQRRVSVDRPFALGAAPVTFAEYDLFARSTRHAISWRRRLGAGRASGDQCLVGRRPTLLRMALRPHRRRLSSAIRSGVGIRLPR